MITLTAMYPNTEGSTFDYDYYMSTHVPLVAGFFGDALVRGTVSKGEDFGGEATPYLCVSVLEIDSMESLGAAFAAHAGEIMGDIPNFTNVQPTMYVGTIL
jgi:uncharacterized protein (TIGR02118 family)